MGLGERLKHGWNAFMNPLESFKYDYGRASYINPTRVRMTTGTEKSIVMPVTDSLIRLKKNGAVERKRQCLIREAEYFAPRGEQSPNKAGKYQDFQLR